MSPSFRRVEASEAAAVLAWLTTDSWPYHRPVDPAAVDRYWGAGVESYWVGTATDSHAGLVRLFDLEDATPLFDLRIRTALRGRGLGTKTVRWLTAHLFESLPHVRRIEGYTREDNAPMRRVFSRCGYVKEAHHRAAWPDADGTPRDAIGYAILRDDWNAGTSTPVRWDD